MSADEKAKEIIGKFKVYSYYDGHDMTTRRQREESNMDSAKECAEICVNEIIAQLEQLHKPEYCIFIEDYNNVVEQNGYEKVEYWQQVLTSINNTNQ